MTANLCDIHYTSESTSVLDWNVCTDTQGTAFSTGLTTTACAHKILSGGDELVADTSQATHLSNTGKSIITCDSAGGGFLFSMDLLPDQKAFAVGSLSGNSQIDNMTVAHCDAGQTTPEFSFIGTSGIGASSGTTLAGVAICGEFSISNPRPKQGVPEFKASAMLVAAIGLAAIVLFRKTSLIKVR
jgi:hypothetical protein